MKKTTCDRGHFYDGDTYVSCPICQKLVKDLEGSQSSKDVFGKEERDGDSTPKKKWLQKLIRSEKHTQELPNEEPQIQEKAHEKKVSSIMENVAENDTEVSKDMKQPQKHTVRLTDMAEEATLASQIAQIQQESASGAKTMALYGTEADPVTGWLVCVRGVEKGVSYPLKTGQNFIGRALNMDIVLHQENSVSRNKHALIVFEPKRQIFLIQQGESSGLTYVNEELLMGMRQLQPYDKLQLGECELIFVPFCGPKFNWKEYL